jgi:hypothetical protein
MMKLTMPVSALEEIVAGSPAVCFPPEGSKTGPDNRSGRLEDACSWETNARPGDPA